MPQQCQLFVKPIEQSRNALVWGNWGQKLSLLEPQVDTLPCWVLEKQAWVGGTGCTPASCCCQTWAHPLTMCWASASGIFEQAKPVFNRIFFRGQALSSTYGRNCLCVMRRRGKRRKASRNRLSPSGCCCAGSPAVWCLCSQHCYLSLVCGSRAVPTPSALCLVALRFTIQCQRRWGLMWCQWTAEITSAGIP